TAVWCDDRYAWISACAGSDWRTLVKVERTRASLALIPVRLAIEALMASKVRTPTCEGRGWSTATVGCACANVEHTLLRSPIWSKHRWNSSSDGPCCSGTMVPTWDSACPTPGM